MIYSCDICDFVYAEDSSSDRRLHRQRHDEHVNGVRWKHTDREIIIHNDGGFRIVSVTPSAPQFLKTRAGKIGARANRDTHFDFGVYDESEQTAHALIGVLRERVISIAVLRPTSEVRKWSWDEFDGRIDPKQNHTKANILGCCFLWVLSANRGSGVAQTTADVAVAYSGVPSESFPWMPPFTELGEGFLRRYCPGSYTIGWP